MADILTPEKRSWNMSRIKGKNTKPEVLLRSLLHQAGFRFRIHASNLPGKPDIVLPRYNTVIFMNGCFWHRHKNCKYAYSPKSRQDFWQEKFARTVQRDQEKTEKLIEDGWQVRTVWECELENNPDSIVAKIIRELKGRKDHAAC
ncbi:MAG: DNA mismatch endonuclease Vsr [Sinomicrobium sp.]|nr:DNA mismatch endonuclease Vsr [Sinomicrobium sp.]